MPVNPSADEVLDWFQTLSNHGRWGDDDVLGTLNHVTPEVRAAAASEVRLGRAVSCAWEIDPGPDPANIYGTPQRHMLSTGEGLADPDRPLPKHERRGDRAHGAMEFMGMVFHGLTITHLDALSHFMWDGHLYNGVPAVAVTSELGASRLAVTDVPDGVLTRGVLLDVAAVRDVPWMDDAEGVYPDDLEAAEARQGVQVGPGDAVLLRTGFARRRHEQVPWNWKDGNPGWHAACLPWLHERGVSVIGCDTPQEVLPSGYAKAGLRMPVHAVGIVAMGLWLVDNCDLEALAATCEELQRWTSMFVLAPLRLAGATGSPVNPLCVF